MPEVTSQLASGGSLADQGKPMHLRVLLPTQVMIDQAVVKIIAEAENGSFCLLPRHIDFVAALKPSVLSFVDTAGTEKFAAVDTGVLVKCDREVTVSTLNGVSHENLEELQALVTERFEQLDDYERKVRTALARLEAGTLRGFWELQESLHG